MRANQRTPEAKKKRGEVWDSKFIPCKKHPERRCNRSFYVAHWSRKCGSCNQHRADGTERKSYTRSRSTRLSEQVLWSLRSRRRKYRIDERKI